MLVGKNRRAARLAVSFRLFRDYGIAADHHSAGRPDRTARAVPKHASRAALLSHQSDRQIALREQAGAEDVPLRYRARLAEAEARRYEAGQCLFLLGLSLLACE